VMTTMLCENICSVKVGNRYLRLGNDGQQIFRYPLLMCRYFVSFPEIGSIRLKTRRAELPQFTKISCFMRQHTTRCPTRGIFGLITGGSRESRATDGVRQRDKVVAAKTIMMVWAVAAKRAQKLSIRDTAFKSK
jgi:hypothetical protein